MSNYDIETIELSIEHAKKSANLKKALERLLKNRDFNTVFLTNYFEQEPARLVLLKADPNLQGEVEQKEIMKQIDAIGSVRQFMSNTLQLGRMAEKAIADDERTRDELLAEDEAA